ncbi:MAG: 30S ribosomal protein S30e [Candidatus Bathyarchaeota archaeon]
MPTHGSLTKAGKVRNQTPKIAPQAKKKIIPKARNLRNYIKRLAHPPTEERRSFGSHRRRR